MNSRPIKLNRPLLAITCLMAILPTLVRGDGSIKFNGDTATTSKLQNDTADVLDGSDDMTICLWINPNSIGEGAGEFDQRGVQADSIYAGCFADRYFRRLDLSSEGAAVPVS